ncbi:MAG: putative arginine biosynthesis protein ArgJ [Schlesneria sp.]|nr:putative arginine biosynthesis protein ArgJ [Schlesneria sp.]
MANVNPSITFVCRFCQQVIKAAATSEGRAGRCPSCQKVVHAPAASETMSPFPLEIVDTGLRRPKLNGLMQGVAVSLALHLVLLSALGVIVFESRELGRSLIATMFFDSEGTEIEVGEISIEMPAPDLATIEGDAQLAAVSQEIPEQPLVGPPVQGGTNVGGRQQRISASAETTGSTDPAARFSSTATERLKRQPAARRGDFEIALFWDGPSDLDLHVQFRSPSERIRRYINFGDKGKPETGFLDVDQNFKPAYVEDPIEHIRWNTKTPPSGTYLILVHGFHLRSNSNSTPRVIPFTVEVKTPDSVRSFSGVVGEKQFFEVDTLLIEGPEEEQVLRTPKTLTATERLLETAKKKLDSGTGSSKREAIGILKGLIRRFPHSAEADEARELLKSHP